MKLFAWNEWVDVEIWVSEYADNGGLAICLDEPGEGPYAVMTVNLGRVGEDEAYVDVNNCPWAESFIAQYGLGEHTGKFGWSGYCIYPLYRFNTEKLMGVKK